MSSRDTKAKAAAIEGHDEKTQNVVEYGSVENLENKREVPLESIHVTTEENSIQENILPSDQSQPEESLIDGEKQEQNDFLEENMPIVDSVQKTVDDSILESRITSDDAQPTENLSNSEIQEGDTTVDFSLLADMVKADESGIKSLDFGIDIQEDEHVEHKEEQASDILEKQDSEKVKEEDEQPERLKEEETSLEGYELIVPSEEDLDVTSFHLLQDDKEENWPQEATESRTTNESEELNVESLEPVLSESARNQYYEMYNILTKEHQEEIMKNSYLLKKLRNYYTQRKMFHVLQEGKVQLDALKKYEKQLDQYESLSNNSMVEEAKLTEEVHDLQMKVAQKENEAQISFENLQTSEYEAGKALIGDHDDKVIDRYLKRQKLQLNLLKKMRLHYIKIRNKVTETEKTLDALDNFGSNLHLVDYEHLKFDNRNLSDKLEEKDIALRKARTDCHHAAQALADRREKIFAIEEDIHTMMKKLDHLNEDYGSVRERLNNYKQERDLRRKEILKMKNETGLIRNPKILRNMCQTIKESAKLADEVQEAKNACYRLTEAINVLRINMSSENRLQIIKDKMRLDKNVVDPILVMYNNPRFKSTDSNVSAETFNMFKQ